MLTPESLKGLNLEKFQGLYICFDCEQVVGADPEDSCQKCGFRYNPEVVGEGCPECGTDAWDSHCEICDGYDIIYLDLIIQSWDDYVEDEESDAIEKAILKHIGNKQ